jgi:hypothetical protein
MKIRLPKGDFEACIFDCNAIAAARAANMQWVLVQPPGRRT